MRNLEALKSVWYSSSYLYVAGKLLLDYMNLKWFLQYLPFLFDCKTTATRMECKSIKKVSHTELYIVHDY